MDRDLILSLAQRCNRCGYCLSECPVYAATGVESSAARGRIALARLLAQAALPFDRSVKNVLHECLLCRACVEACPPSVETDKIVAALRHEWHKRFGGAGLADRVFHSFLPDRRRLERQVRALYAALLRGAPQAAAKLGLLRLLPGLALRALDMLPEPPRQFLTDRLARLNLRPREAKLRVGYFVSCGMNMAQPEAAEACVRLLVKLGCEVVPLDNVCCGLPPYAYGDMDAAAELALANARAFARTEGIRWVVSDCGSCSAHLRECHTLPTLAPRERELVRRLSERVRDVTEVLCELEWPERLNEVSLRVTYHDPCHLSRYLDTREQARALLRKVPGLMLAEMPRADMCCGGAGTYGLEHPEISQHILDRKIAAAVSTGAEAIVTSCPSCMLQLAYGLRRRGLGLNVLHICQVLDRAVPEEQ